MSWLTSTVLKAQMRLENKAASDSKPRGCAVFFRKDHQIIRLIFLCACSGDNFKQVFLNLGSVAEASSWKAEGLPVWPVRMFTFLLFYKNPLNSTDLEVDWQV